MTAGFGGSINLIPGGLTPFQGVCVVLAVMCFYFLKADPEFRIRLGPWWVFWPLLGLNLILLYNWIKGRDLGLNLFGSRMVGGKGYIESILPFVGYIAALSLWRPDPAHDRLLPIYVASGYFFDSIIFALTTFAPALAPHLYRFYSSVNVEAFGAVGVSQVAAVSDLFVFRFGTSGTLGVVLLAALQVYLPYRRWLALPQILIGPAIALFCVGCALISGFRNSLAKLILVFIVGVWQSFRLYSFLLALPFVALVGLMVAGQGNLYELPATVQRTMTWLPGDWDPAMKESTKSSNEFRETLRRLYFREFFKAGNYLGEGYLYNREDMLAGQEEYWKRVGYTPEMDKDQNIRVFIIRRQHHEGLLNVHHITGHVGTLIWASFTFLLLWKCTPFLLSREPTRETLSAHFGATLMVISVIGFWLFFGSIRNVVTEIAGYAFCFYVGMAFVPKARSSPVTIPPDLRALAPAIPDPLQARSG